jgi:uncharacterized protein (TIGR02145 family)
MRNVILILLALLIGGANGAAQVSIGKAEPSRAGAGLDLNSNDKGLLLPNVSLSNTATDFQLGKDLAPDDPAKAAGMVVYNDSETLGGPGVFVWSGTRWILITCKPATPGTITLSATTVNLTNTFTASVPEVNTGTQIPTSYTWELPTGLTGISTSHSITITGATAGSYASGTIKVTATNACGTSAARSSASAVTVRVCSAAPAISSPTADQAPANQLVGATYAMTVTADGKGATPAYQWQSSSNGNDSWTDVSSGGNADTYNAPTAAANVGITYYRCKVTTACGEAFSPKWKITVVTLKSFALDKTTLKLYIGGETGTITAQNFIGTNDQTFPGVTATWSIVAPNTTGSTISSNGNTVTVTTGSTVGSFTVRATAGGITKDCVVTIEDCSSVTDYETISYPAAKFGAAGCWMTQNLRSKKYSDGTTLSQGSSSGNNDKYFAYPDNNSSASTTYGLLYSWAAASGITSSSASEGNSDHAKRQGICPTGWHLPSDKEWSELEKEIATNPANYSDESTAYSNAADFKYGETTTWRPGSGTDATYWGRQMKSTTAVNSSYPPAGSSKKSSENGFDALLVGNVNGGTVYNFGSIAFFWSSSSRNSSYAWYRVLAYNYSGVNRTYLADKYTLYTVRCKKD